MVLCCASGCNNQSGIAVDENGVKVSFARFPADNDRKKLWASKVPRLDATNRKENWFPTQNSRICTEHFLPDQFVTENGKRKLKPDAIPTVFYTKKAKKVRPLPPKERLPLCDSDTVGHSNNSTRINHDHNYCNHEDISLVDPLSVDDIDNTSVLPKTHGDNEQELQSAQIGCFDSLMPENARSPANTDGGRILSCKGSQNVKGRPLAEEIVFNEEQLTQNDLAAQAGGLQPISHEISVTSCSAKCQMEITRYKKMIWKRDSQIENLKIKLQESRAENKRLGRRLSAHLAAANRPKLKAIETKKVKE